MLRQGWESMRKLACVLGVLATLVLSACGGDATLGSGTDPDNPESQYQIGSLNGTAFSKGALAIGQSEIASGGSTSLAIDIVDSNKNYAFGVSAAVGFSSTCLARGLSEMSVPQGATTTGSFTATYTAKGCSGTDVVTAIVQVDGVTLRATGTIEVQPAELGGLEFLEATPSIIGMTGSPLPTQSAVQFRLTDAGGSPLANRRVDFSLSTAVGGIQVTPTSAISDASGVVRTVVQAGSVHTSVRVRASTTNATSGVTISSQSGQLVITTGLPDQDSFSISATEFAIDGGCDGQTTTLNIRAADRYNNPAPPGTAVSFTSEGGKVNGQCLMAGDLEDPSAEAGVCSVLLTVQNPRPSDGRVTVLASAIGEESFTDANGNGFRDAGEPFTDLPEAFVDFDEDNVRDAIEPILDFNGDGIYNLANGIFDGYICEQAGVNCRSNNANIRQDAVIVFSDVAGGPVVTPITGVSGSAINVAANATIGVSFSITDSNGNSLPTGTTFTLETSDGEVLDPGTVGPFNTINGDVASFLIKAPDAAATGIVSLKIKVPAGACSGADFTVNYTLNVS